MTVSFAPHLQDRVTVNRLMLDVIIALLPALAAAVYVFGSRAALIVGVCVVSCVFFEWAFEKLLKRNNTIKDLSAVVTGILLALCLPEEIPIGMAVFGSFTAIVFVKQLFGGLGKNFANPAITARIVLFAAFPASMATWDVPFLGSLDFDFFAGSHSGYFSEANGLALVLGGAYLIIRRVITWHTPVTFIAVVFALTAIQGSEPMFQIFSGGLLVGAFFMATDSVTSPLTNTGRVIFGAGAGLLTVLIRYGNYHMAVSFAILLMNMVVPHINRLTIPRPLGSAALKRAAVKKGKRGNV